MLATLITGRDFCQQELSFLILCDSYVMCSRTFSNLHLNGDRQIIT